MIPATTVATKAANNATGGMRSPNIPRLVRVAKIPAAGVKPPYIQAWKAAAAELPTTPAGPKPRLSIIATMIVNVMAQAMMIAKTAEFVFSDKQ